jgi:hypothetical protein
MNSGLNIGDILFQLFAIGILLFVIGILFYFLRYSKDDKNNLTGLKKN